MVFDGLSKKFKEIASLHCAICHHMSSLVITYHHISSQHITALHGQLDWSSLPFFASQCSVLLCSRLNVPVPYIRIGCATHPQNTSNGMMPSEWKSKCNRWKLYTGKRKGNALIPTRIRQDFAMCHMAQEQHILINIVKIRVWVPNLNKIGHQTISNIVKHFGFKTPHNFRSNFWKFH